jgi:hypothetical protein
LEGQEFGCRITSVKLVTDGDYLNARGTRMGATINQFTAECDGEGDCSFSTRGTIFVSKGFLGLRFYQQREYC